MATLFQLPKATPISAGSSYASAKAYFYQPGTTTAITTYTTAAMSTPHASPVVADANGVFAPIFIKEAVNPTYRLILHTSADALIYDLDNLPALTAATNDWRYRITSLETAAVLTTADLTFGYDPGDFRRYGAAGDGSTDDGTAIRNAILQSLQTGGALPFGQPGATYLCTTWTPIDSTSTIRIAGNGCTLKGPSPHVDFCRPGGNVAAEGVTFDRWLSVGEREVADTGTITRFVLDGVRLADIDGLGVNIERPISNFRMVFSEFENTDGGYTLRIGRNTYAEQDNWSDGVVAFNDFSDIDGSGTESTASMIAYGKRMLFLGNRVDDVDQTGTGEAWGRYLKQRYSVSAFNISSNIDAAGSSDVTGFTFKGELRSGSSAPQGFGCLSIGDIAYNIGLLGTRGSGFRAQTDEFYIAFGYGEDTGINGVVIDEPDGNMSGSFYNRIRFSVDTGTTGIRLSQGGVGIRSVGDEVHGAAVGVRCSAGGGSLDAEAMVVEGLVAEVTAQAVLVNTTASGDIDGLTVQNVKMTAGTEGLRFDGGTVTNARVLDNDFRIASSAQIAGTLPADIEIRHCWTFQTTAAGPTTAMALTLADEASYAIELRAVAVLSDGAEQNMYHREALFFRNGGGGATIVGTVQDIGTPQEVTAAWDATLDASGNTVRVQLTGEAAHTINWKLWIHVLGINAA